MDYNPDHYNTTSYDTMGPAKKLIHIIQQHVNRLGLNTLTIVDFGCGPGNTVRLLSDRFPQATIWGFDIKPEMVEYAQANRANDRCHFRQQDLSAPFVKWPEEVKHQLQGRVDVIFSNYTLQWIFDPKQVAISMRELLKPKTGLLAGNILYSDILAVLDNESDRKLIEQWLNYPTEQQFISEWLFALKDLGQFWNFLLEYEEPLSIYPEQLYTQSYINIPLTWHKMFARAKVPNEVDHQLDETIKKLILKKRINRVIPRMAAGSTCHVEAARVQAPGQTDQTASQTQNDIEIKQQLWTITLYKK